MRSNYIRLGDRTIPILHTSLSLQRYIDGFSYRVVCYFKHDGDEEGMLQMFSLPLPHPDRPYSEISEFIDCTPIDPDSTLYMYTHMGLNSPYAKSSGSTVIVRATVDENDDEGGTDVPLRANFCIQSTEFSSSDVYSPKMTAGYFDSALINWFEQRRLV